MAKRRVSFRAWHGALGPSVPLRMVPQLVGLPTERVRRLVESGVLTVHTFRTTDGRSLRYVTLAEVRAVLKPEPRLTVDGMRRAMSRMLED